MKIIIIMLNKSENNINALLCPKAEWVLDKLPPSVYGWTFNLFYLSQIVHDFYFNYFLKINIIFINLLGQHILLLELFRNYYFNIIPYAI